GHDVTDGGELRIEANWVGPGYFRTMGIPVTGRDITEQDRQGAPLVAVINETMARRWWSDQDPVGRTYRMFFNGSGPEVLIVGVAQDVKEGLAEDPEPYIYYPIMQHMDRALAASINLLVATDAPALQILPTLRSHIRELDSQLAISDLTTLQNRFADFLMPQRMGTTLLTTLGGLTVLLAVVGITGVVGYAVNQRRREIGIRLALGATNVHVVHVIVRGTVIPVAVGLGVGIIVAFGVTRLITNFMFGITPTDPAIFVAVPLLTLAVTLVAAYLPARRATIINPTEALRSE
ncbi:MAG: ABC transporter permease, partial [Gemmatimonadetes bacterium]|nr:ABC transporter permease [Gemmatimonadota bacterium]